MLRGMAMQDMLASEPVRGATLRRLWSDLMAPFMDADRVPMRPAPLEAAVE